MKKIILLFLLILIIACRTESIKKDLEPKSVIVKEPEIIIEPKIEKTFVKTLLTAPAGYPKKIPKLSELDFKKAKEKIELSVSKYCKPIKWDGGGMDTQKPYTININQFGYLNSLNCYNLPEGDNSGTAVKTVAKNKVKEYERYLGIENVDLEFEDYRNVGENFFINTKPQMYKELPVFDGSKRAVRPAIIELVLTRTDMLSRLNGHYFNNIDAPV